MFKLFRFNCVSPLELAVCKERLTREYYLKLHDQGLLPKFRYFGWNATLLADKRADAKIESSLSRPDFTYHLTLEAAEKGTIIHCKLNPFALTGWLLPLILIFAPFVVSLPAEIAKFLDSGTFLPTLVGFIAWATVIGAPYRLLEHFARKATKRLLGILVNAN